MASTNNKIVKSPTTLPACPWCKAIPSVVRDKAICQTIDCMLGGMVFPVEAWSRRTASIGDAATIDKIVDAVWLSVDHDEAGDVWLDRSKALARVRNLLVAASPSDAAEIETK